MDRSNLIGTKNIYGCRVVDVFNRKMKNMLHVECVCGKMCVVQPYNFINNKWKTCIQCKYIYKDLSGSKIKNVRVVELYKKYKTYYIYKCVCDCNNLLYVRSNVLQNKHKFVKCNNCKNGIFDRIIIGFDKNIGKKYNRWKILKIDIRSINTKMIRCWCKCDCGIIKSVLFQSIKNEKSKSCGCYNYEQLKKNWSGKNNPKYNPDLSTDERNKIRSSSQNTNFINYCYKRDKYTCQLCGDKSGGNLNVHHLDGWNWCKKKRYDVQNGITLCKICHQSFHSMFGVGNNTKEQFMKYFHSYIVGDF